MTIDTKPLTAEEIEEIRRVATDESLFSQKGVYVTDTRGWTNGAVLTLLTEIDRLNGERNRDAALLKEALSVGSGLRYEILRLIADKSELESKLSTAREAGRKAMDKPR